MSQVKWLASTHDPRALVAMTDLGRWRGWLYRSLAGNALSPARFHHPPPNRVVELGTQIAI